MIREALGEPGPGEDGFLRPAPGLTPVCLIRPGESGGVRGGAFVDFFGYKDLKYDNKIVLSHLFDLFRLFDGSFFYWGSCRPGRPGVFSRPGGRGTYFLFHDVSGRPGGGPPPAPGGFIGPGRADPRGAGTLWRGGHHASGFRSDRADSRRLPGHATDALQDV
jgi:hypothetical protein